MPTESCYLEWKKYYRISRIGISFIKTLAFSFSLSCLYYIDSSVAWRHRNILVAGCIATIIVP